MRQPLTRQIIDLFDATLVDMKPDPAATQSRGGARPDSPNDDPKER